jgi:hypothetical protein
MMYGFVALYDYGHRVLVLFLWALRFVICGLEQRVSSISLRFASAFAGST